LANPPEVSQLDLRGLGPDELATILSGGINIGKIRADQVQAQQQAELENVRNLILQQQAVAKERKDEAYQKYLDGESTRKEAADAARAADQDADRKVDMLRADAAMTAALRPPGGGSRQTFKTKDAKGNDVYVFADGSPAPGIPTSDTANQANPLQTFNLATDLVATKSAVLTGKNGAQELPEASRDAYMKLYNDSSTDDQIVKTDAVAPSRYDWNGTPAKYDVVPKNLPTPTTTQPPGAAYGGVNPATGKMEYFNAKGEKL